MSAYECGFDPFGAGVSSFEVHFYLVGVLFIIFDLEIVFLYPWAVNFRLLGGPGFFAVLIFLGILTVGFIYEWQKGALDWSRYEPKYKPLLAKVSPQPSAPPVKVGGWVTPFWFRVLPGWVFQRFLL